MFIDTFKYIYKTLTNISILQIIINVLITYVCFTTMTPYSLTANVIVSSILISCNLLILVHEKKNNMSPLFLAHNRWWVNLFIIGFICFYFCVKNLFCIEFFTLLVFFYSGNAMNLEPKKFNDMETLTVFIGIATFIQLFMYYRKFKRRSKIVDNFVKVLVDKYKLDFKKTEFFIDSDQVIEFKSGGYVFKLGVGLVDGERCYPPSVVLDYFNITGIGFNDLDEGHVKNIEMYGMSA